MNLEKMSEELANGVKTQENLSNIMGQLAKKNPGSRFEWGRWIPFWKEWEKRKTGQSFPFALG